VAPETIVKEVRAAITAAAPTYPLSLSPAAVDLLARLLAANPDARPSATDVLAHPWIHGHGGRLFAPGSSSSSAASTADDARLDTEAEAGSEGALGGAGGAAESRTLTDTFVTPLEALLVGEGEGGEGGGGAAAGEGAAGGAAATPFEGAGAAALEPDDYAFPEGAESARESLLGRATSLLAPPPGLAPEGGADGVPSAAAGEGGEAASGGSSAHPWGASTRERGAGSFASLGALRGVRADSIDLDSLVG
jgi:hypothetical protein